MTDAPSFTRPQKSMLSGAFYIDGWHNRRFIDDAADLVARGYLTVREGGDSQYTSYHYEPTSAGREALERLRTSA